MKYTPEVFLNSIKKESSNQLEKNQLNFSMKVYAPLAFLNLILSDGFLESLIKSLDLA